MRNDMSAPGTTPIHIGGNNKAPLKLLDTCVFVTKAKRTGVRYHHIHNEQKNYKTVVFRYVNAEANLADRLTKPDEDQIHIS